ncbi:beta-galactosidase GalA [Asticcacaulis solisilvae]|uniref:beta-galactosidase GalA n=1 Tax=Asticcacaulis solisilvae TaxID=1217274 RepID=UPI003FD6FCD4
MTPHRRDILVSASVLALMGLPMTAGAQTKAAPADGRSRLDEGWKFAFGHLNDPAKDFGFSDGLRTFAKQGPDTGLATKADFDDSKWRDITLPHDWAVELPFVPNPKADTYKPDDHGFTWDPDADHGFKPLGRDYPETSIGWYRRPLELTPHDKGKRIRIDFDSVFRSAIVMFNGYIVKEHDGGYVPFSVDVTDFLNTDGKPNVLAVRVDASLGEGWFYEGAGIYRHVWLVKHDPVHVVKDGVCVRARTDGTVEVSVTIRNDSDQVQDVGLQLDAGPEFEKAPDNLSLRGVAKPQTFAPFSTTTVTQTLKFAEPVLWSIETPTLYRLSAALTNGGKTLGTATTRFGFRDIRFDADLGFFLNGKPVKLKGTCNHQDHAGVGSAIPDALNYYRIKCLKEMGCNAWRTSHNPPAPELLDACDELGMLVIDETRMMTSSEEGLDQLRTMIVRDRNHPSIILWSIGNEEPQQWTERGANIARTMKRVCRELDPTRGITAAMDGGYGQGITEVLDVIGFNYRDNKIDDFHKAFPHIPIIGTETASTVATRGEYVKDPAKHIVPAYDTEAPWWANTAEGWWPHFDARPYIAGGFIWTGFDYRGEPTPYPNWPSISSQFGALDTCGFPKDNYYYYRAWWRPEPLLHLFPHWNWEAGSTVSVWAYSNCDAVELFVNGKSLGRKDMAKDMHVEWSVPYQPGKIVAYGYTGGKVVIKDSRETAGAAARVVLTADRTALTADGRDCAVIRAEVVDARGRTVPRAGNLIRFDVAGSAAVIGVGNGDPNCHEADKATQRSAFNGLACAIVQAGKAAGPVTVTATADGLVSGKVVLKTA